MKTLRFNFLIYGVLSAGLLGLGPAFGNGHTPQGACGGVKPVKGGGAVLNTEMRCKCSGGEVHIAGQASLPGVSGGGSYSGGTGLVCQSYTTLSDYDAYTSDGNALVAAGSFVYNKDYDASCDTSGCGKFLGFLWSTGSPSCTWDITPSRGGHQSYIIVGNCPGPEEVLAATQYTSHYETLDASAMTPTRG